MANWFEDHPARSIIVYSVFICAATWGASRFLLQDGRIDQLRGEIGELNAQLETAGIRSSVEKSRIEVLETQVLELRTDNARYRELLIRDPKSFAAMEEKIKELEKGTRQIVDSLNPNSIPSPIHPRPYSFRQQVQKGASFIDPLTDAMIGVQGISVDGIAFGTVSIPGQNAEPTNSIKPAVKWSFKWHGKSYVMRVVSVNYVYDQVVVEVIEADGSSTQGI